MKEMKTLTLNGEQYQITDAAAARIDDGDISESTTWSGQKLSSELAALQEMMGDVIADGVVSRETTWSGKEIYNRLEALRDIIIEVTARTEELEETDAEQQEAFGEVLAYLEGLIDDPAIAENKTWSSQKINAQITELNGYVNDNLESLHNKTDSLINDDTIASGSTWSSGKLYTALGDIEAALDSILAMQNSLIGGDSA